MHRWSECEERSTELLGASNASRFDLLRSKLVPLMEQRRKRLQSEMLDLLHDFAIEHKDKYWHSRIATKHWEVHVTRLGWEQWHDHRFEQSDLKCANEQALAVWTIINTRSVLAHWREFALEQPALRQLLHSQHIRALSWWTDKRVTILQEAWGSWRDWKGERGTDLSRAHTFWIRHACMNVFGALVKYTDALAMREMQWMQVRPRRVQRMLLLLLCCFRLC